jgi:hypothetical protein
LEGLAQGVSQLHYFDPDIVLGCKWPLVRRWATKGIALSEDFNGHLPARHPLRLQWKAWLSQFPELNSQGDCDRYYSGGYVGLPVENVEFLKTWAGLIDKISLGQDLKKYCLGDSNKLFYVPDQDALNIALMCGTFTVNGAGVEGMAFAPWGRFPNLLFHAIGYKKPWMGGCIKLALRGHAPTYSARMFLKHMDGPIRSLSPYRRFVLKLDFRLALQLSRLVKPTEYRFRNP